MIGTGTYAKVLADTVVNCPVFHAGFSERERSARGEDNANGGFDIRRRQNKATMKQSVQLHNKGRGIEGAQTAIQMIGDTCWRGNTATHLEDLPIHLSY
jgi:hypothetical protein